MGSWKKTGFGQITILYLQKDTHLTRTRSRSTREFLYESDLSGACLLCAVIDFRGASHEKKEANQVPLNSFVHVASLLLGLAIFFAEG